MTNNIYDRGDVVRLTASFTNISHSAADPAGVTLRIRQPDATVTVHTYPVDITRDGTGQYHFDLAIAESGDYYYRFEGTGAVQAAAEGLFHVYKSNVI